jgi:hypothetical protein
MFGDYYAATSPWAGAWPYQSAPFADPYADPYVRRARAPMAVPHRARRPAEVVEGRDLVTDGVNVYQPVYDLRFPHKPASYRLVGPLERPRPAPAATPKAPAPAPAPAPVRTAHNAAKERARRLQALETRTRARAASIIQRTFRAYWRRVTAARRLAAATLLQRVARGFLARQRVARYRTRLAALAAVEADLAKLLAQDAPAVYAAPFKDSTTGAPRWAALALEEALLKLLMRVDGILSDGHDGLRLRRKRLTSAIHLALERFDRFRAGEPDPTAITTPAAPSPAEAASGDEDASPSPSPSDMPSSEDGRFRASAASDVAGASEPAATQAGAPSESVNAALPATTEAPGSPPLRFDGDDEDGFVLVLPPPEIFPEVVPDLETRSADDDVADRVLVFE